jgi:hypothetical protein
MSLSYLAAAVWLAFALLMWVWHPSDIVWLIASLAWAVVFFGVFMWGLACKAAADDRSLVLAAPQQTDIRNA